MNVNGFAFWTSSCAVTLVLIASFVISGSPGEQRLVRLDELRVAHLVQLTEAFDDYWEVRDELPVKMSELLDGRRLSRMPSDQRPGWPMNTNNWIRLVINFAQPLTGHQRRS